MQNRIAIQRIENIKCCGSCYSDVMMNSVLAGDQTVIDLWKVIVTRITLVFIEFHLSTNFT